jgi:septum formation protein
MSLPPLILASASPRREELLRSLGIEFSIVPSDASELHDAQLTAREISQINAYRKARAVAKHSPEALVIGADTLVYLGTKLFGKPADPDDARRMLGELQGKTHEVVTGVCFMHLESHRCEIFSETTSVTFHPLTPEQIADYVQHVNTLDKAGAYAVQDFGERIIEEISGSFSNVVGLPLRRVRIQLEAW